MWGTYRLSPVHSGGSSPILGLQTEQTPMAVCSGDHVNRTGPNHLPLWLWEAEKKLHPGWRDQEIRRSQRWYWGTQPEEGGKATLRQKPLSWDSGDNLLPTRTENKQEYTRHPSQGAFGAS